jgi:uncharacterized protein YjbJ (UPF0337 family)
VEKPQAASQSGAGFHFGRFTKFKGSWQQFKGEIKQKWGQFTDNDLLEAEGDYDKFLGVVQKRYGEKREEVERWAEDWHERNEILARKAIESRNQM